MTDELISRIDTDYPVNAAALAEYMQRPEARLTEEKIEQSIIPAALGGLAAAAVGGPIGLFALASGFDAFKSAGNEDAKALQDFMERNAEEARAARERTESVLDSREERQQSQEFALERLERSHELQVELETLKHTPSSDEVLQARVSNITSQSSNEANDLLDPKMSQNITPEAREWANAVKSLEARRGTMSDDEYISQYQELIERRAAINAYQADYFGDLGESVGNGYLESMNSSENAYDTMHRMKEALQYMDSRGMSLTGTESRAWWNSFFQRTGRSQSEANELSSALASGRLDAARVLAQAFKPVSEKQLETVIQSLQGGDVSSAIAALNSSMSTVHNDYQASYRTLESANSRAISGRGEKLKGSDDLGIKAVDRVSQGDEENSFQVSSDPVVNKYLARPF